MAAKKQTASKGATQKPKVPSIDARIDRLVNREVSSIKAIASVNIGGAFAIHGIRVIDSQKGLFVAMPSNSYTDAEGKTQYSDICHPVTAEARNELISKVEKAYEQALTEQQTEEESESESELESESESMGQTM